MYYWVEFNDRTSGTIKAENAEQAKEIGTHYGQPRLATGLPYPASPFLNKTQGDCPEFCYEPDKCKGRSSCPNNYACSN